MDDDFGYMKFIYLHCDEEKSTSFISNSEIIEGRSLNLQGTPEKLVLRPELTRDDLTLQTDRQTSRQTYRQTDINAYIQTYILTYIYIYIYM